MSAAPSYEARVMTHPHARKGKITQIKGLDAVTGRPFTDSQGEPDVFPDVTVRDPNTETYYRARGYIVPGEVPAPPAEYAEYPVMLVHPGHVDAVPVDWHIEKGDNGEIIRHRIEGKPEVYPPRQANDEFEERDLEKKGYARVGHDDPEAIRRSAASPYVAGRKTQEFPKMVGGVIEDPDAQTGGPIQYPKWIGDKLVNSRAEEEALTGRTADVVLDVCIICDEVILQGQTFSSGKNGMFHTSHVADNTAIAATPLKETIPVVIHSRRAAREAIAVPPTAKKRGRPAKVKVSAGE